MTLKCVCVTGLTVNETTSYIHSEARYVPPDDLGPPRRWSPRTLWRERDQGETSVGSLQAKPARQIW